MKIGKEPSAKLMKARVAIDSMTYADIKWKNQSNRDNKKQ